MKALTNHIIGLLLALGGICAVMASEGTLAVILVIAWAAHTLITEARGGGK